MTDDYPIHEIIEDIENQNFVLVLSHLIVRHESVDVVKQKVEKYIERYSRALKP